ncbi:iron transporter [Corynebacterium mendelii]|uniref:Iron transporter n=1 Tax=Corynebacterium mendelii TaxID=2765362 RepID=A0A939IWC5_9CORY|nr:iron transporter [Corynebacterium mendelii]MBN9643265.1 iron transporter [Corynebacterium mendelii]
MTIKRTVLALTAASTMALVGLSACAENNGDTESATTTAAAQTSSPATEADTTMTGETTSDKAAPAEDAPEGAAGVNARPDECGLQEQQGPEASFGPFDVSIHYFQPGEMLPNPDADMTMASYADSQMHLEVDTKVNEFGTNWGWSVDETPADLRMFYKLEDPEGKQVAAGMMMEMNAIDGSHYGTNLVNDTITGPGEYTMTLTVYPPKNYSLHGDYITGVPAEGWFKPLTVVMPWKLTQDNLDIVKENKRENPMTVPDNCKDYPVKQFSDPTAEAAMKKAEAEAPLPMMG